MENGGQSEREWCKISFRFLISKWSDSQTQAIFHSLSLLGINGSAISVCIISKFCRHFPWEVTNRVVYIQMIFFLWAFVWCALIAFRVTRRPTTKTGKTQLPQQPKTMYALFWVLFLCVLWVGFQLNFTWVNSPCAVAWHHFQRCCWCCVFHFTFHSYDDYCYLVLF